MKPQPRAPAIPAGSARARRPVRAERHGRRSQRSRRGRRQGRELSAERRVNTRVTQRQRRDSSRLGGQRRRRSSLVAAAAVAAALSVGGGGGGGIAFEESVSPVNVVTAGGGGGGGGGSSGVPGRRYQRLRSVSSGPRRSHRLMRITWTAPAPAAVTAGPASLDRHRGATLTGTVNPNGSQSSTDCQFTLSPAPPSAATIPCLSRSAPGSIAGGGLGAASRALSRDHLHGRAHRRERTGHQQRLPGHVHDASTAAASAAAGARHRPDGEQA